VHVQSLGQDLVDYMRNVSKCVYVNDHSVNVRLVEGRWTWYRQPVQLHWLCLKINKLWTLQHTH